MEYLFRILGEFREQMHQILSRPASTTSFSVTHLSRARSEIQIKPYTTFHLQLVFLLENLKHRNAGEQFVLNLDNTVFNNENLELFSNTLHKIYNNDITSLDFGKDTTSIINKWAADHTNGLLKTFFQNPPALETTSSFLDSSYFKADWEAPFPEILNNVDVFNVGPIETVKLYMMGNILDIPFAETKTFRIVCLPYENGDVGMCVILPNKDDENKYNIRQFVVSMDPKEILRTIEIMKPHNVTIKIPKLYLSNKFSVLKPLQKYSLFDKLHRQKNGTKSKAIDELFNRVQKFENFTTSNYQDIFLESTSRDANLRVSDIVQQKVFSINEKGTEAAAISGGITDYIGGAKTVVLNRPHTFFIRHEETQTMIFRGTITNPPKN